jgi:signal transduction histidine kinase
METILIENQINIEISADKNIIVNADPMRIEQIIINFLNNAVNHLDEKKKIKIKLIKNDNKVKILVFNTGKHIEDNSLNEIWTSFYKVDKARTREYGGTGLGLSIVRAIQKAHKNDYGVYNIEGGVEFWFNIDLSK